ncbi:MAG: hypothetical protein AAGF19_03775 [Pseudomonadota bacterium]
MEQDAVAAAQDITVFGVFGANVTQPAFWGGVLFIALFAFSRFVSQSPQLGYFDPPIANRHYTTRFRYYLAAAVYVLFLVLVYSSLVFVQSFPDVIERLGPLLPLEEVMSVRTGFAAVVMAVILTVFVIPALRPLAAIDEKVRDYLHNFASVPEKAWMIASQLVEGVDVARFANDSRVLAIPPELVEDDRWSDPRVYLALRKRIETMASPGQQGLPRYRRFFSRFRPILDRLDESFDILHGELQFTAANRAFYEREMTKIVERLGLLFACAILAGEEDEYKASVLMRDKLKIRDADVPQFRFVPAQIIWAVIIISVSSILGIGLAAGIVRFADQTRLVESVAVSGTGGQVGSYLADANFVEIMSIVSDMMLFSLQWSLVTVPFYLMPLVLAVGVQMYISDRKQYGLGGDFNERLLATAFTFVFAFMIAVLPIVLAASFTVGDQIEQTQQVNLGTIFPWAFAPTVFATVFVFLSNRSLTGSRFVNFFVDFTLLATATGLANYLGVHTYFFNVELPFADIRQQVLDGTLSAQEGLRRIAALQEQMGQTDNPLSEMPKDFTLLTFALQAAFTGGFLGALTLFRSRQRLGKTRAAHWAHDEGEAHTNAV